MTTKTPAPVVPKLRFPEFKDSAAWDTPRGDKLFDSINNRNAPPGLPVLAITQEHGAIPREDIDYHVSVTAESVASYKEVCEGDFIISLRSFQGGIEYSRFHGICSPAYVVLRRKGEENEHFFRHLFKSDRFIQRLTRNIEGIRDGKMISYAQFSEQLLPVPTPAEQQKIADCLGSLDELIAAESRKLEALRRHKQGLMQRLFPQPGEDQPEVGRQVSWEQFDLQDMVFFQEGPGIMAADFCNDGIPLVRLAGLAEPVVSLDGCNYLSPERVAEKWEHFRLVEGDILISASASFGRPAIVTSKAAGSVFYTGLIRFRPSDDRLQAGFLRAFLDSPNFMRQATAFAVGGGIKHFGPSHLRQMTIQLPADDKQEQIASVCFSIDDVLAAQSQRVEGLNRHRHGLLQQIFPNLEAN